MAKNLFQGREQNRRRYQRCKESHTCPSCGCKHRRKTVRCKGCNQLNADSEKRRRIRRWKKEHAA